MRDRDDWMDRVDTARMEACMRMMRVAENFNYITLLTIIDNGEEIRLANDEIEDFYNRYFPKHIIVIEADDDGYLTRDQIVGISRENDILYMKLRNEDDWIRVYRDPMVLGSLVKFMEDLYKYKNNKKDGK